MTSLEQAPYLLGALEAMPLASIMSGMDEVILD